MPVVDTRPSPEVLRSIRERKDPWAEGIAALDRGIQRGMELRRQREIDRLNRESHEIATVERLGGLQAKGIRRGNAPEEAELAPDRLAPPAELRRLAAPSLAERLGGTLREEIERPVEVGSLGMKSVEIDPAGGVGIKRTPSPFTMGNSPRFAADSTALSEPEERVFQEWARAEGIGDVDHPESHYDYRGYWRDIASKGGDERKEYPDGLHFPDTYKRRGHPTFSEESKYSHGPGDGGRWGGADGETFTPAAQPTQAARLLGRLAPSLAVESPDRLGGRAALDRVEAQEADRLLAPPVRRADRYEQITPGFFLDREETPEAQAARQRAATRAQLIAQGVPEERVGFYTGELIESPVLANRALEGIEQQQTEQQNRTTWERLREAYPGRVGEYVRGTNYAKEAADLEEKGEFFEALVATGTPKRRAELIAWHGHDPQPGEIAAANLALSIQRERRLASDGGEGGRGLTAGQRRTEARRGAEAAVYNIIAEWKQITREELRALARESGVSEAELEAHARATHRQLHGGGGRSGGENNPAAKLSARDRRTAFELIQEANGDHSTARQALVAEGFTAAQSDALLREYGTVQEIRRGPPQGRTHTPPVSGGRRAAPAPPSTSELGAYEQAVELIQELGGDRGEVVDFIDQHYKGEERRRMREAVNAVLADAQRDTLPANYAGPPAGGRNR